MLQQNILGILISKLCKTDYGFSKFVNFHLSEHLSTLPLANVGTKWATPRSNPTHHTSQIVDTHYAMGHGLGAYYNSTKLQ